MVARKQILKDSSLKSRRLKAFWPWWQVDMSGEKLKIVGRTRAPLSPYVVNLRPDLYTEEPKPASISIKSNFVPKHLPVIDFLKVDVHFSDFVPPSLYSLLTRWPNISSLGLVTVLDIAWFIVGLVSKCVVYGYMQLAVEIQELGRSIKEDIKIFAKSVGRVFGLPLKIFTFKPVVAGGNVPFGRPVFVQLGIFVIVALFLVLPFKIVITWREVSAKQGEVVELANQAIGDLKTGGMQLTSGQTALAQASFENASQVFNQALNTLGVLPDKVLAVLGGITGAADKLETANHLLVASREASEAAALAAHAWQQVVEGNTNNENDWVNKIEILQSSLIELQPHLTAALENLRQVDVKVLPVELQSNVASLQTELDKVEGMLAEAFSLPNLLQNLIASPETKRYLILFQNSNELRPTGGFTGSLALVEIKQGKVEKVEIPGGGPYDFQGSLKRVIAPPEPLRLVRGEWQLQDANWFFDFPTSARKVIWFLKESGGPEVDGVMAMTPDIVTNLLKLTGPIDLPQYKKVITDENFLIETQKAVEFEYDQAKNRPKQFIADLAPILLTKVLELKPEFRLDLTKILEQSLRQRSLQFYLNNPTLEAKISAYGWGGEVKQSVMDYLAVVRTNIGGGKTDAVTDDKISHEVEVLPSGELIAHITFTRTHTGDPRDIFDWRRNVDYVRFYVPRGSKLISAEGFTPPPNDYFKPVVQGAEVDEQLTLTEQNPTIAEAGTRITEEFGKTVFANWLSVAPGETNTAKISYRLPFILSPSSLWQDLRRYSIYFQRQAGVRDVDFTSTIKLPDAWRVRWQEGSHPLELTADGLKFKSDWQQDEYYGVVVEKPDKL